MKKPKILVIAGPTATGKTTLGIEVAKAADGEVVSADSMQVYKYMDIGTAKPTPEEKLSVPHHMIDIVEPWEDYSVARYVREAQVVVDDILHRGKLPIIVGGSGLYIDSLLSERTFTPRGDKGLRKSLESRYDNLGGEKMLEELRKIDPPCADKLHPNDKKRIVRALEAFSASAGKTISQHDEETKNHLPKYDLVKFVLTYKDRAVLYEKINRRVDEMILNGLENEVASLINMGVSQSCTSLQAIGYKQLLDFLNGNEPLSSAIDKIKMESRRLAKRQLTWFRRDASATWHAWDEHPDFAGATKQITGVLDEA